VGIAGNGLEILSGNSCLPTQWYRLPTQWYRLPTQWGGGPGRGAAAAVGRLISPRPLSKVQIDRMNHIVQGFINIPNGVPKHPKAFCFQILVLPFVGLFLVQWAIYLDCNAI
jgi:hypothetical protein